MIYVRENVFFFSPLKKIVWLGIKEKQNTYKSMDLTSYLQKTNRVATLKGISKRGG